MKLVEIFDVTKTDPACLPLQQSFNMRLYHYSQKKHHLIEVFILSGQMGNVGEGDVTLWQCRS